MKYVANPVQVDAFKIEAVFDGRDAGEYGVMVTLVDPPAAWHGGVRVTEEMVSRYVPVAGDYYVVQDDGYAYVNPKAVFERKYHHEISEGSVPTGVTAAEAINLLQEGTSNGTS